MSHNKYTHLELQPAVQFLLIGGSSIQKQFLVNRQQVLKPKLLPKVNASIHLTLQLGRVHSNLDIVNKFVRPFLFTIE